MANLSRHHRIEDLRQMAKRSLPLPIFDYLDGGAEDERALVRSTAAFDDFRLVPRALVDMNIVDTQTTLFGQSTPYPIMLAPTGLTSLFHRKAEDAVAAAASSFGLPYCLSTLGTVTVEEFGKLQSGPKLLQLYIFRDRGLTEELIERAAASSYDALVLTVDTAIAGKRIRDLRNGLSIPPRLTLRGLLGFARRPSWSLPALFGKKFEFANLAHRIEALGETQTSVQDYVNSQFDRTVTWRDVEWLASRWKGHLAVKGILSIEDARAAVDAGATTVMVSNHGGRQLDSVAAPIEQIATIADAVRDQATIICDGGIRRGSDIVKALALGAHACSIGRPYLFGLAAGGSAGVRRALDILTTELHNTMTLMGTPNLESIDRERVAFRVRTQ